MFSIIFASLAPSMALLSFFYLKDQFNTEPIGMVVRSFIFGALIVFPVVVIQYAFQQEGYLLSSFSQAFISAALIEEFLKWFILFYTVYSHVHFDEHYDGIVYGVSISLGFATLENIFYLFIFGVDEAFIRALFPVSSHALFGVIMGYYLGKAKFSRQSTRKLIAMSLFFPWLLHGIFDYILIALTYWPYFMLPFMFFLWWLSLKKVKLANAAKTM